MREESYPPVDVLNRAFEADPAAIYSLATASIPCNWELAKDPHVVVGVYPVLQGVPYINAIGLINGVLGGLGLPLVAINWSDVSDDRGYYKFLGFSKYEPPLEPGA